MSTSHCSGLLFFEQNSLVAKRQKGFSQQLWEVSCMCSESLPSEAIPGSPVAVTEMVLEPTNGFMAEALGWLCCVLAALMWHRSPADGHMLLTFEFVHTCSLLDCSGKILPPVDSLIRRPGECCQLPNHSELQFWSFVLPQCPLHHKTPTASCSASALWREMGQSVHLLFFQLSESPPPHSGAAVPGALGSVGAR